MAKGRDQKKKILYVYKILAEQTNEKNPLTAEDLIKKLDMLDIDAERKSIYKDIEVLQDMGCDIINQKTTPKGYFMASGKFELVEIKLLIDAVQSSRFINKGQSDKLVEKLKTLTNKYEAKALDQRSLKKSEPVKNKNIGGYNNVDSIYTAINNNFYITFRYNDWNVKGEYEPKYNGKIYEVSPYALTWDDDSYYMIGYDHDRQKVRTYRVDKIDSILVIENSVREGHDQFKEFDLTKYREESFGMFSGKPTSVTLQYNKELSGVMRDRFGTAPMMSEISQEDSDTVEYHGRIRVDVAVSKQFYGWLTGLGRGVRITHPESVVKEYKKFMEEIMEIYSEGDK